MKKIITLLFLIIVSKICVAQVPNWLWAESSNSTGVYEYPNGLSVDTITNNVFASGRCGGNNTFGGLALNAGGAENPFMGRFDKNGNAIWLSEYTYSSGFDYPYGFYRDSKDNTYSDGTVNSSQSAFIEKYNSTGILQWEITPGANIFSLHGIAADGKGCVYVSGWLSAGSVTLGATTLNYSGSGDAVVVAKLDPTGNFLWAKEFYGTGNSDGQNTGRGLTIDSHANIYVAGGYTGAPVFGSFIAPLTTGNSSLFIVKMDSSGKVLNLITSIGGGYANNDCCGSTPMTIDSCSDLYLAGYFQGSAQFGDFVLHTYGGQDGYIAKCDHDGNWDWAQNFGGTGDDAIGAITIDKNTDVYVGCDYQNGAAQIEGTSITGGDMAVIKLDNGLGFVDWIQTGGASSGSDGLGGITVDNKGYIYVIGSFTGSVNFGTTNLNNNGLQGTNFLAKLDTLNHISIVTKPDSVYCAGKTYTLPYSISGTFTSGNIFTAQLSDASGSFANAVNIGSFISTISGTITITIPSSTPYGTHYRIRILSTRPSLITTIPSSSCIYRPVDTAYFYITIYPIPSLVISGKNSVCSGDSTVLSTYGANHYLWNTGDTTSSIKVAPTSNTQYSVILTNGPCVYNDTTTVSINPSPIILVTPPSAIVCSGKGLSLSASGASTYQWSPANGLNATTGTAVYAGPDSSTVYTILGTDTNGCTGKTTVTINVGELPKASFTVTVPNPCAPQQLQFKNSSTGSDNSYTWRFGDGTTGNEQNPSHTYASTGTFNITLVVTSPIGCADSLTITETISSVDFIFIPNAFIPVAEGLNQKFKPNVLCTDVTDYIFRVYDRWGMLMYETTVTDAPGWDGIFNGKQQPLGTYVYYLKMDCGTCSVFKKGTVTLVR